MVNDPRISKSPCVILTFSVIPSVTTNGYFNKRGDPFGIVAAISVPASSNVGAKNWYYSNLKYYYDYLILYSYKTIDHCS